MGPVETRLASSSSRPMMTVGVSPFMATPTIDMVADVDQCWLICVGQCRSVLIGVDRCRLVLIGVDWC
jgi:hypothetical protein